LPTPLTGSVKRTFPTLETSLYENLSPRLVRVLADSFPNSTHVHECGLGSAEDSAVWEYAKTNGFVIVSKDSDFQDRSVLYGHPPKVIWLRTTNCSTSEIESVLRAAADTIKRFIAEDQESYLVLGARRKPRSTRSNLGGS
jgi:predicted nuclease of predicted toxin-antitoxin system